ncbi:hypothetical protein [Acinetobacter sp. ABJ_C5_2]|uniref:hypothetical protein n=1 Tax=Acinetobacter sp. ABJ_C5_2 TaxID=3376992 RepID=UPI0037CA01B3
MNELLIDEDFEIFYHDESFCPPIEFTLVSEEVLAKFKENYRINYLSTEKPLAFWLEK